MHCFNESAPLANIFDCMKGHNRKLNRLREKEHNGSGAVKMQDRFFEQTDWSGGHQGWVVGLALTHEEAHYSVATPRSIPSLPSIQLCIIGLGTDGLLLPLVTPHPSLALTRERKKS